MKRARSGGAPGDCDSGIKYHLEKMKATGASRHVGPTKAGYWEVLE